MVTSGYQYTIFPGGADMQAEFRQAKKVEGEKLMLSLQRADKLGVTQLIPPEVFRLQKLIFTLISKNHWITPPRFSGTRVNNVPAVIVQSQCGKEFMLPTDALVHYTSVRPRRSI
jgi:hypothetical protein